MAIFNKIFNEAKPQLTQRLFDGGFSKLGAQVRPADKRTTEQLIANIEYYAQKNPVVAKFAKELKEMNPKHLGLVSDTLELASKQEFLLTNINMNEVNNQTGKSLLQHLLEIYPKASKENPNAIEFAQEVINNTDSITSKYFLADMNGYLMVPEAGEHMKSIKPLIKDFAESTINDGYTGTFEKQANFTSLIKGILTPNSKPEKIAILPKLIEIVDKAKQNYNITLNRFTMSNTPLKQVEENIEILPKVIENAEKSGKSIDVVDFVNNNVNLI